MVPGESEEGVEADDVVEEEGNDKDCGQPWVRQDAMLAVFISGAEGKRVLLTLEGRESLSISQDITPAVSNTKCWWIVQFDCQPHVGDDICCRQNDVQNHDGQNRHHLHHGIC